MHTDPIVEEVDENDGKKFLTNDELHAFELGFEQQRSVRLELDILKEQREHRKTQKLLYEVRAEVESLRAQLHGHPCPTIEGRHKSNMDKLTVLKANNAKLVAQVKEKYGVTGEGFGYNPDTGEISIDTEEDN